MKPKAIVFDAYGTLLNLASIDQRLEHYFGEQSTAIAKLWRSKQLEYSWLRTLMHRYVPFSQITREALFYATAYHNKVPGEAVQNTLLKKYNQLTTYLEVKEILAKLSLENKLAVLSNADRDMLKSALIFNDVIQYFDAVLSADDVRAFKPSPAVYQLAIDTLSVNKNEVLFISSNAWDVVGAKTFGFNVFWVNRKSTVAEVLGVLPDQVIDSLLELPAKLEEL